MDLFSDWIPWLIITGIILAVGIALKMSIKTIRRIRGEDAKQKAETAEKLNRVTAQIETEMIQDISKKDEFESNFIKYTEKHNIYPDSQGRFYDPDYGEYITPATLEARNRVIKPQIFIPPGTA